MTNNRWLLPEGIDEVLPPQAAQLEKLCRKLIDLYASWGYELVMPPMIEFLDSLLTGTGEDLNLQTFKIVDQLTGRSMGLRADATPQVARIDAHNLKRNIPTRLCYLGSILHTRPTVHGGTRAPLQTGAELYGHASEESDAEILSLMLKTMKVADIHNVHVDMGHVGIYRGLSAGLEISTEQEQRLFDGLQRKDTSEILQLIQESKMTTTTADNFLALIELNGGLDTLTEARKTLKGANSEVMASIDQLERIAELVQRQVRNAPLFVDLAELRGYHYYTGMSFATYVPGEGQGIAFGGRYDDIGKAFGRLRPATGFSADIKMLFNLISAEGASINAIYAPASEVPGLSETIDKLRGEGEVVISELPGQSGSGKDMQCDRELYLDAGTWKIRKL